MTAALDLTADPFATVLGHGRGAHRLRPPHISPDELDYALSRLRAALAPKHRRRLPYRRALDEACKLARSDQATRSANEGSIWVRAVKPNFETIQLHPAAEAISTYGQVNFNRLVLAAAGEEVHPPQNSPGTWSNAPKLTIYCNDEHRTVLLYQLLALAVEGRRP